MRLCDFTIKSEVVKRESKILENKNQKISVSFLDILDSRVFLRVRQFCSVFDTEFLTLQMYNRDDKLFLKAIF